MVFRASGFTPFWPRLVRDGKKLLIIIAERNEETYLRASISSSLGFPCMYFREMHLKRLLAFEVLITTFFPAEVARPSRGLLQFEMAFLILMGVQLLDVLEVIRAFLAPIDIADIAAAIVDV